MKHLSKTVLILLYLHISCAYPSDENNQTQILLSGNVSEAHKDLMQGVKSYPAMGIIENETEDDSGGIGESAITMGGMVIGQMEQDATPLTTKKEKTYTAQQYIQDRTSKATFQNNVAKVCEHGNFGIMHGKKNAYQNYPQGESLFKNYDQINKNSINTSGKLEPSHTLTKSNNVLAQKFNKLINTLIQNPSFTTFFRKVHLNILNELYKYLMNIYTNFNLQHVGIKEVTDSQGQPSLKINIPLFLQNEQEYDQNKKTLIINHFINVIESQMNGAIRSVMPNIPHLFATYTGKTLIQNDYSIDLTHFIVKQIEPDMKKRKKKYLEALAVYLDFFQEYTSLLLKPHPVHDQHYTAFLDVAETINQYLHGSTTLTQGATAEDKMKHVLEKMDPPMFTFNYDDIRAIKMIPSLAKTINPKSKKIEWPEHIVEAANEGIMIDNRPIAYFMDASGEVVREAEASKLFIVMQSGKNFFQEELLAQPDWLNNESGIINILRGCFGDFSALVGRDILDPCMEALVQNALDTLDGKDPNEQNSSYINICQNLIDSWKDEKPVQIPQSSSNNQKLQNYLDQTLQPNTSTANNLIPSLTTGINPSLNDISNIAPSSADISSALTQ